MSSTQVHRPVKVHNPCVKTVSQDDKNHQRRATIHSAAPPTKKNKYDDGRFKFGRKRCSSFTAGNGKFFPPYKKRKREGIVPPTKFLLGGNIFDPLNLNSLQDEEINRAMNAVTPKSSPLPTPKHRKGEVEVIIPPNINDPLNLIDCDDDAKYEEQLVSPKKVSKNNRKRKKKKRNSSSSKDDSAEGAAVNTTSDETFLSGAEESEVGKDPVNKVEAGSMAPPEAVVRKEVRDLRKELDLPLKDDDKKSRKSEEGNKESNKSERRNRKVDLKDKIVSPVIPQPGAWKRPLHRGGNMGHGPAGDGRYNRFRPGHKRQQNRGLSVQEMPKFQEKNTKFQYGNYNRYYGYRNPSHEIDVRLKYFQQRKELFYDKDVLDIGCNIGHITLSLARDFGAKSVVGLDIDRSLIDIARINIRHYVNYSDSPPNEGGSTSRLFPISMPILYGPVDIPGITKSESPSVPKKFPHNVSFVQGNYVLESDVLLQTEQPQFDVILALSITKWMHLNWGDAGLKRAFKRMYAQLRPGGKLVLEAQAWDSYKRKKNLTETIFKNYNSIEFLPDKFTQYLLSSEVGFSKCEVIGTPFHHSRGFQRPIQLFTKGESPTHSAPSTDHTPCYAAGTSTLRVPVYASVVGSSQESDSAGATPAAVAAMGEVEGPQAIPVYTPVGEATYTDDSAVRRGEEQQATSETTAGEATAETHKEDVAPPQSFMETSLESPGHIGESETQKAENIHVDEESVVVKSEDVSSDNNTLCQGNLCVSEVHSSDHGLEQLAVLGKSPGGDEQFDNTDKTLS